MFATFSTEPGDHLERYALFKFNDDGIQHVPVTSPLYLVYNEVATYSDNITIRGHSIYHYWHTGWDVIKDGDIIPVYDFLHKDTLFPQVPLVRCAYDYIIWCNYRIRDQKIIYSGVFRNYQYREESNFTHIARPVAEPEPVPVLSANKLPTFVAEALIKAAKDSNAECSISMTPFKECSKISVTNCYHCFETESLDEWRNRKTSCPVCKCEIKFITNI
jgi:hypothetical protein